MNISLFLVQALAAASPEKSNFFKWPLWGHEDQDEFPFDTRAQTQAETKTKKGLTSVLDWVNPPAQDPRMKSRGQKLFRQSRKRLGESIWAL